MRVLHWFRSDLRLRDNTALAAACAAADRLVPVFVLDERLLGGARRATPRLRFMLDCLERLDRALRGRGSRLVVRSGDPRQIIPRLTREHAIDLVTWNRDYGPYAKRRDAAVGADLERAGVRVRSHKDRVVWESDEIRTAAGTAYSVYTPYRRAWWRRLEEEPPSPAPRARIPTPIGGLDPGTLPSAADLGLGDDETAIPTGGEEAAGRRLRTFLERDAAHYAERRDFPAAEATSRLSPYLRLGVVSVRACLRAAREASVAEPGLRDGVAKWLDELIWREFYHAILDAFPHVAHGAFRREYDAMQWDDDDAHFAAWCEGATGYPFVDAAMRELAATGWMHNRARMVVASFLTKDLLIDWRRGERFFMQRLVDGDPAANNGGWQWAASTGTDAQPYFRIFNPVSQGERFDPRGEYVRRWVPELEGLLGKSAHRPWETPLLARGYPAPIVDHAQRRKRALARYEAARRAGER